MTVAIIMLAACGKVETQGGEVPTSTPPIITRVDPATAAPGDTVTIFGFGFTSTAQLNFVFLDSAVILADSYEVLATPTEDEIEAITFTVPDDSADGDYSIMIEVYDNLSNTDKLLTIAR